MSTAVRDEILDLAGSRRYLLLALGAPLTLYLLYTITGFDGGAGRQAGGTTWGSWFMVSMATFGTIGAAVGTAGTDRHATPDDRPRRRLARFAARTALVLPPIALIGMTGAIINGVDASLAVWLGLLVSLWLGSLPFVALALLLDAILDPDAAGIVALAVVILLGVMGALFQPLGTLSPTMKMIAQVLPSYHLAALGWASLVDHGPKLVDVTVLAGYTATVGAILRWRADDGPTKEHVGIGSGDTADDR